MSTPQLRIGVLGTGWGTTISVPAFRAEGWDVAALWSQREQRARAEAARLNIPFATNDYQSLIQRDDLDAVHIVTPTHTHRNVCIDALRARKHVLCEKPLALNAQEAEEMVAVADAVGMTTMVNFEYRFAPQWRHVKWLLDEGYIGRFRHATIELNWTLPRGESDLSWRSQAAMGGGLLNEHGSHYVDSLRQWFGEVTSVSARLEAFAPERRDRASGLSGFADTEDFLTAAFTFATGGVAVLTQSWAATVAAGVRVVIVGSKGMISAAAPRTMLIDGDVYGARQGDSRAEHLARPSEIESLDGSNYRIATFRRLIGVLERGVRDGHSPSPNFVDGLHCQVVLDAVRESARLGQTVTI